MKRELIKIGDNIYIVENSPSGYEDFYVLGSNVWQHLVPGWGSSGHGETKKILASTRRDLKGVPVVKSSFLSSYSDMTEKELKASLDKDFLFMHVDVEAETEEEACERCFEEMKKINPKGGPKEFVRLAVLFGINWNKNNTKTTNDEVT